jgi:phosphoglycolate phosphatase-like HAD superfamily hydrolase
MNVELMEINNILNALGDEPMSEQTFNTLVEVGAINTYHEQLNKRLEANANEQVEVVKELLEELECDNSLKEVTEALGALKYTIDSLNDIVDDLEQRIM